jgi:hypothetical protein
VNWVRLSESTVIPYSSEFHVSNLKLRLCLNIGWLYIRLVAHNSLSPDPVDSHGEDTPNEHSPLILPHTAKWQAGIRDFMAMWAIRISFFCHILTFVQGASFTDQID